MPLAQIKRLNTCTLLGRWTLTETVTQLQAHPDLPAGMPLPETLTHQKRQIEWLASRILAYQVLRQFTPTYYTLSNEENGRPYFAESSYQISISHTQNQVAVLISEGYGVGIDIERIQPKVSWIQDKFLSLQEKSAVGDDLIKLTIAWSAKETLYKLYGKKNVIFNKNLLLFPFNSGDLGSINALIYTTNFQQKYTVYFEVENDTVLTYCLDDSNKHPL